MDDRTCLFMVYKLRPFPTYFLRKRRNELLIDFQTLEEKERKVQTNKDNLLREQRYLRRRLELLSNQVDAIHKRRSLSECSTSTVSSSHSSNSESGRMITFKQFEQIFNNICQFYFTPKRINLFYFIYLLRRWFKFCLRMIFATLVGMKCWKKPQERPLFKGRRL